VTVSDVRSAEALAKEILTLMEAGIMVETGGHGLLTFRRQDLIVVSPGVPLELPELVQVKHFGLPVIGELELAARFLKGHTLAVTGSNMPENHPSPSTAARRASLRTLGGSAAPLVARQHRASLVDVVSSSTIAPTDEAWR